MSHAQQLEDDGLPTPAVGPWGERKYRLVNPRAYVRPTNKVVDNFLGDPDWRSGWAAAERRGERFGAFIADVFGRKMAALKYIYSGPHDMVEVRSADKNLPLYHLAFFSRHELGRKFWQEARKYSSEQRELF